MADTVHAGQLPQQGLAAISVDEAITPLDFSHPDGPQTLGAPVNPGTSTPLRRAKAPLVHFGFQDGRRHGDARDPQRIEFAGQDISVDPAAARDIAESSIRGDHGWMEGDQCFDISEPCS